MNPPMANPAGDALNPGLQLSDACFMQGGNALAAPVTRASDQTEMKLMAVEGAVDALFALALGGFVGIAVEKKTDRRKVLKLRETLPHSLTVTPPPGPLPEAERGSKNAALAPLSSQGRGWGRGSASPHRPHACQAEFTRTGRGCSPEA